MEQRDIFSLDVDELAAIAARPPAPQLDPEQKRATEAYARFMAPGPVDAKQRIGTANVKVTPAFATAPTYRSKTFGMVHFNYVIKTCPRCGATPAFVGAIAGELSWAHTCRIEGDLQ